jgi:hypothetical protein
MVGRGSTVRVRQRASRKGLQHGYLSCLSGKRLSRAGTRGALPGVPSSGVSAGGIRLDQAHPNRLDPLCATEGPRRIGGAHRNEREMGEAGVAHVQHGGTAFGENRGGSVVGAQPKRRVRRERRARQGSSLSTPGQFPYAHARARDRRAAVGRACVRPRSRRCSYGELSRPRGQHLDRRLHRRAWWRRGVAARAQARLSTSSTSHATATRRRACLPTSLEHRRAQMSSRSPRAAMTYSAANHRARSCAGLTRSRSGCSRSAAVPSSIPSTTRAMATTPSDAANSVSRGRATVELRRRLNALNGGIAKLARERGLLLADLERLCHGHGLASDEPWFVQVIEPNLAAATAIAEHWHELLSS